MTPKILDLRGRPCPEPVLECRKALMEPGTRAVVVIVDSEAAVENVARMAASLDCSLKTEKKGEGEFHVLAIKTGAAPEQKAGGANPGLEGQPWIAVLIASASLGQGSEELGKLLMGGFVKTLKQLPVQPECILFINSGIQLTTQGSPLIAELKELEGLGVQLLSCGTCLDYFKLKEKLMVGRVTNMFEIVSILAGADRVIRP
jgi:selenium metabolism protein YedF